LTAWGNDVRDEFKQGIQDIVAVHLKDTLEVTDTFSGQFKNVPFGSGCVDFPLCFQTLEQLGYQGPYLVEMWYHPTVDYLESIKSSKAFLEDRFATALLHLKSNRDL
jgi:L-ribulose-5-phosphate 3-epimerase